MVEHDMSLVTYKIEIVLLRNMSTMAAILEMCSMMITYKRNSWLSSKVNLYERGCFEVMTISVTNNSHLAIPCQGMAVRMLRSLAVFLIDRTYYVLSYKYYKAIWP